jgi:hypothetical protein
MMQLRKQTAAELYTNCPKPMSLFATYWCPEGDLNPHDRLGSADFKSAVSADFTIRASEEQENSLSHLIACHVLPPQEPFGNALRIVNRLP